MRQNQLDKLTELNKQYRTLKKRYGFESRFSQAIPSFKIALAPSSMGSKNESVDHAIEELRTYRRALLHSINTFNEPSEIAFFLSEVLQLHEPELVVEDVDASSFSLTNNRMP